MCAQPVPGTSGRPRITPIQWIGLTVLGLLLLNQLGLLQTASPTSFIDGLVDQLPFFIAIIVAVTIHEFSHARVATWFGDDLPRRAGRLTLNPLAHLDLMGSLLFLVAHFGWGKPVPINPGAMRNPNLGWALSSAAGPGSNLITAALTLLCVQAFGHAGDPFVREVIGQFVLISIVLAIFNLIPLAPLDGFGFVFGLSPRPIKLALLPLQSYGPLILLALLFLPRFVPSFPPILQVVIAGGETLFFSVVGVSPRVL